MFEQYSENNKILFELADMSRVPKPKTAEEKATFIANSKRPKHEGWQSEAVDPLDLSWYEGNLGWRLGIEDVVLDIDPRRNGDESFTRLCQDLKLDLLPTVYTARGDGGFHVYLKLPEELIGAAFKKEQASYPGIDFITHGRYVVAAGSMVDGKQYIFADPVAQFEQPLIPEALSDYYRKLTTARVDDDGFDPEFEALMAAIGSGNETLADIQNLLAKLDPDMGHDEWLNVGMAIHSWSPDKQGLEAWDEWSKGSEKYVKGETKKRWRSFENTGGITLGTLKHQVRLAEYDTRAQTANTILKAISTASIRDIETSIAPKIRKSEAFDDLTIELFAQAIKKQISKLNGVTIGIATARDMIAPAIKQYNSTDAPDWCVDWVYINRQSSFLHISSKQLYKSEGFNILCGKDVPAGERGAKPSATKFVSDNGFVKVANDMLYMPSIDAEFFKLDGYDVYNSFNPNSVPRAAKTYTPEGKKAISRFERHLSMLCNGDKKNTDILRYWLAAQVQNMGAKITWSPIIQSIQGTGKSYLGEVLRACIGASNVGVVDSDQVRNQFNSWATGVCVNVLEELRVQGLNRHEIVNKLKPLVTDNRVQINPKGKDQYPIINTTNYICFTNFKDALPLDNDDRRWWILFVDIENSQDIGKMHNMPSTAHYFKELYSSLNQAPQLRKYFLEIEISEDFKNLQRAPDTIYKTAMIANESSNLEGFDETTDVIENELENCRYCEKGILSSYHLFNYIELTHQYLNLTSITKNQILKKLGYIKYAKRVRYDGTPNQLWTKRVENAESIQAFLERQKEE